MVQIDRSNGITQIFHNGSEVVNATETYTSFHNGSGPLVLGGTNETLSK